MSINNSKQKNTSTLSTEEVETLKVIAAAFQKFAETGLLQFTDNTSTLSADLSVPKLAAYLDVSIKTIYRRAAPNSPQPFPFKTYRTGRKLRFRKSEVDAARGKGVI